MILVFLSIKFWITGYYIRVGFGMQVTIDTELYPVMCRFPLSVALCDHNPPTLQTDGRHARIKHDMLI